jgi:phosphatidylserine/phosphatidylglycerophosphate/cardiolipin synthase-like enzyme
MNDIPMQRWRVQNGRSSPARTLVPRPARDNGGIPRRSHAAGLRTGGRVESARTTPGCAWSQPDASVEP